MTRGNGWRAVGLPLVAALLGSVVGTGATLAIVHGGGDRGAVEGIVHDYLLAHPDVLPEAMARLQARETAKDVAAVRPALLAPFAGAWAGDPNGDVTLVMFTDYSCGYCRASVPDIDRLLAEDKKLKVVWREIPILGPGSGLAAQAALAAAKQGRFPAFHRAMFAAGRPDAAQIAATARQVGLDQVRLAREQAGADVTAEIDANLKLASRLGISGTPAFVIGDALLSGAVGHDALAAAIAAARRRG